MNSPALRHIYNNLASRATTPQVEIQAVQPLGLCVFKVVASTHGVSSEGEFADAIAAITGGRGRLVSDSFKQRGELAIGVVVANAQSKPLDASFTLVTAATAADASGVIWRVESDGGGKRVVLESSDDLMGIFSDRMARRARHVNPVEGRNLATASFNNGDLVRYVDVGSATASWGVVMRGVDGVHVYGPELVLRSVDPHAVIAAIPRGRLPQELAGAVQPFEMTGALSSDKMAKIISYLKQAFGPASSEMMSKYSKLSKAA